MRSVLKPIYKIAVAVCMNCITMAAIGQQTETGNQPQSGSSDNYMVILMGLIALILAFVIYGMGQVLITLGRQLLEKSKEQSKVFAVVVLVGLSLLSLPGHAQEQTAATAANDSINYGGMGSTGFWVLVSVILTEFIAIIWIMFLIRRLQVELIPQKEKTKAFTLKTWWARIDKRFFTKAIPIEKEQDVMLDHDYDGIRELDNSLPPWWKWGFAVTIIVALVYLVNFHVMGYGKTPAEEYTAEMEKAKEEKAIYEARNANKIDEDNIKMPDATGIAAGKDIFMTTCFPCHGKAGEGGAGPNLTDDYWLHKGSISDIYKSIKHGYPDKGMQAWEKNFSPKEINNIAGFIKTLRGTNPPNAKAAQGDVFIEAAPADSVKANTRIDLDSVSNVKRTAKN